MKAKNNANRFLLSIFLSILFLLVIQCSVPSGPVFQKDGKFYGKIEGQWGGRWWNYYQRGLSYSQGAHWDYAIRDFQEAIKRRAADQRRARTYGLHFQDDYFPHRELGIVYYHQNRLKEAIEELEISLSQFESAKAKYFLNESRREFLKETGLDQLPPDVYIASPKPGFLTRFSTVTISGEALDDQYVESIIINSQEIPVELASSTITFQANIKLERGENKVLVEAIDLIGRNTRKEIVIWCDQEAPMIYIDQIVKDLSSHGYTIAGYIDDLSGVSGFWLNGSRVDLPEIKGGAFSVNVYSTDLKQPFTFQAVDTLGNSTSGQMEIAEIFSEANFKNSDLLRLAFSGQNPKGIFSKPDSRLAYMNKDNKSRPIIILKEIPDHLTVDWDECFLEGEVRAFDGVSAIQINGTPLITRTAKLVFFNYLVPLEVGENIITIQAETISGELETKKLYIERKLNNVQEIDSRLVLAIKPFKYFGDRNEIKSLIYDSLIQYFKDQGRFKLVDRERVDEILIQLRAEKDDDPSWIEIGRIVAAEGVIVGNAYFFDNYLEIIARAGDPETTIILDSKEVFGPIHSLRDVNKLTEGLSLKFKQAFPLVEGNVLEVEPDVVRIDLGEKDHLLDNMKVIFFREGTPINLPGSEVVLEKRFILLREGRIEKKYKSSSDVKLIPKKDGAQIEVDDHVITK